MAIQEDKNITASHILPHPVSDQTTQSIKSLAHIGSGWIKPVAHGVVQVKHGSRG